MSDKKREREEIIRNYKAIFPGKSVEGKSDEELIKEMNKLIEKSAENILNKAKIEETKKEEKELEDLSENCDGSVY